jgi:hypothetical protein
MQKRCKNGKRDTSPEPNAKKIPALRFAFRQEWIASHPPILPMKAATFPCRELAITPGANDSQLVSLAACSEG